MPFIIKYLNFVGILGPHLWERMKVICISIVCASVSYQTQFLEYNHYYDAFMVSGSILRLTDLLCKISF